MKKKKRQGCVLPIFQSGLYIISILLLLNVAESVEGQTSRAVAGAAAETEATESFGLGQKSRFTSGATPVKVERVDISPGTPLQVKATMDSLVGKGSSSKSFGGILGRYDTSTFGKFFASGSLNKQTSTTTSKSKLEDLSLGDNLVDNSSAKVARMYPPRYYVDPMDFPISREYAQQRQKQVNNMVKTVLARFSEEAGNPLENIELRFEGEVLVLLGTVHSSDLAETIVRTLYLEPGIDRIENKLEIRELPLQNR